MMGKIKHSRKSNFTTIDNTVIKDNSLTWKARGIFNYLWSMPEDWDFYMTEVVNHSIDGMTALKSGIKELEEHGYLRRTRIHGDGGKIESMLWELSDTAEFNGTTKQSDNSTIRQKTNLMGTEPLLNKNNTKEKNTLNKDNINSSSSTRDSLDTNTKYIDSKSNNAFELYQIHVGMLSGAQTPIFIDYVQTLGDEVVQFAINLMLDQTSRPNFKYLQKILMKYENLNVRSVDEAKKIESQRQNRRSNKPVVNSERDELRKKISEELGW